MHIWGIYVHMYTKYEVSMSNHMPGGGVQDNDDEDANDDDARRTIHDCIRPFG